MRRPRRLHRRPATEFRKNPHVNTIRRGGVKLTWRRREVGGGFHTWELQFEHIDGCTLYVPRDTVNSVIEVPDDEAWLNAIVYWCQAPAGRETRYEAWFRASMAVYHLRRRLEADDRLKKSDPKRMLRDSRLAMERSFDTWAVREYNFEEGAFAIFEGRDPVYAHVEEREPEEHQFTMRELIAAAPAVAPPARKRQVVAAPSAAPAATQGSLW